MRKKSNVLIGAIAGMILLPVTQLLAQAPMGGGLPCGTVWTGPCVPIDGGISFLVAAGIAYGGKKLYAANVNAKKQKI